MRLKRGLSFIMIFYNKIENKNAGIKSKDIYVKIEEYINKGCLIQCNYGSILGQYGKEAKKTIKTLLKKQEV